MSGEPSVIVYVDIHEPRSIFNALSQLEGVTAIRQTLDAGDYYIPGDRCSLLIERKTTVDYVNSLFSTRLWSEIEKLKNTQSGQSESKLIPILLVEGSWFKVFKWRKRADASALASAYASLLSVIASWGVNVISSPSSAWTPYVLVSLARWVGRSKRSEPPVYKPRADSLDEMALRVLCSLPHISTKRARDILSRFGSVWDSLQSLDEWVLIPGIGEKTVSDVRAVLTHKVHVSAGSSVSR